MPSSPNGPCRTGNDDVGAEQAARRARSASSLAVVASSAPSRSMRDGERPRGRPRAGPPRTDAPLSQRDVVLGRAPAGEDGDPHGVGVVGVVAPASWSAVGVRVGVEAPDDDRHRRALLGLLAARRGPGASTMPSSSGSVDVLRASCSTLKPASVSVVDRVGLGCSPVTSGTVDRRRLLGDRERDGRALVDLRAAGRVLRAARCPGRWSSDSCSVTRRP